MWSLDPDTGVVEVTGRDFAATKKFRDVASTARAAPRHRDPPAPADAIDHPRPRILIHPRRIIGLPGRRVGEHERRPGAARRR
jgi:hypothetical protein